MNGKPVFLVPAKSIINFDSGFRHKLLCDGLTFTAGGRLTLKFTGTLTAELAQLILINVPHAQAPKPTGFAITVMV